jgi:hypothetical protein
MNAPFVAFLMPDDTWLLSITVALLVAMVILVDDRQRHRCRHAVAPAEPVRFAGEGER